MKFHPTITDALDDEMRDVIERTGCSPFAVDRETSRFVSQRTQRWLDKHPHLWTHAANIEMWATDSRGRERRFSRDVVIVGDA